MSDIKAGDRCTVSGCTIRGVYARVLAVADGYAMCRYPRCEPFVQKLENIRKVMFK